MGDVIEWSDRYGGKYPNPETLCLGPCDGLGCFPVSRRDSRPEYALLWQQAEEKKSTDDGWHIVKCPDCNGTGKQQTTE